MFHSQVSHFSQIGVSVQEAEQNKRYTVKHIPFGKQMVFEYKNETDAEMYVVLDEETTCWHRYIWRRCSSDLVNLLVFIINQRITVQDLNKLIFAFPSASSGVIDLLKVNML